MTKTDVASLIKKAQAVVNKRGPEILTGIGIAGMITTTVFAVRATPKAMALIEEEKLRRYKELEDDTMTKTEVVKTAWKCYIPATVTGAVSIACLIGATSVSARRTAALAAAYQLSETAFSEYKEKVIETIGEKKEQVVKDKVAEKRIEANPVTKSEVIVTSSGTTLCFDPISSRYFKSSIDKIKRAENELNKQMLHDISGYVSLNEFYDELDLDHIGPGDDLGWNVNELIDMGFSSQIADNDEPCIVLDYRVSPKYNYSMFM